MHKAESHALQFYLQSKVCEVSSVIPIEKSNGLGKGELAGIALYKELSADLLLIDDARAKKVAYQKCVNNYYRGINMNTKSLRQYADVENGFLHIKLPQDFDAKRVELTIVPLEEETTQLSNFQQFLLDSPEMSDEEFQSIREKREHLNQWK